MAEIQENPILAFFSNLLRGIKLPLPKNDALVEPAAVAPSAEPMEKKPAAVAPSAEPMEKKPAAVAPSAEPMEKKPAAVAPSAEPAAVTPSAEPMEKKPAAVAPSAEPMEKKPAAVVPSAEQMEKKPTVTEDESDNPSSVKYPRQGFAPLKLETDSVEAEPNTNPILLWQVYAIGGFFILRWAWKRWNERKGRKKSDNEPPTDPDDV